MQDAGALALGLFLYLYIIHFWRSSVGWGGVGGAVAPFSSVPQKLKRFKHALGRLREPRLGLWAYTLALPPGSTPVL